MNVKALGCTVLAGVLVGVEVFAAGGRGVRYGTAIDPSAVWLAGVYTIFTLWLWGLVMRAELLKRDLAIKHAAEIQVGDDYRQAVRTYFKEHGIPEGQLP